MSLDNTLFLDELIRAGDERRSRVPRGASMSIKRATEFLIFRSRFDGQESVRLGDLAKEEILGQGLRGAKVLGCDRP